MTDKQIEALKTKHEKELHRLHNVISKMSSYAVDALNVITWSDGALGKPESKLALNRFERIRALGIKNIKLDMNK